MVQSNAVWLLPKLHNVLFGHVVIIIQVWHYVTHTQRVVDGVIIQISASRLHHVILSRYQQLSHQQIFKKPFIV